MSGSANASVHIDSGASGASNRPAIFRLDERLAAPPPELILGLKNKGSCAFRRLVRTGAMADGSPRQSAIDTYKVCPSFCPPPVDISENNPSRQWLECPANAPCTAVDADRARVDRRQTRAKAAIFTTWNRGSLQSIRQRLNWCNGDK